MKPFNFKGIEKSPRIQRLIDNLFIKMPEIEPERAVLLTESFDKCTFRNLGNYAIEFGDGCRYCSVTNSEIKFCGAGA